MPLSEHDTARLARALALARKGAFQVEPNPPVGCVIERAADGIVGESWHGAFGGPHAEVGALALAGETARGATAYVSLAPCGVQGKTPPCADALVDAGIARVVYAVGDPHPDEGGRGLAVLREAGIETLAAEGRLREEGEALIARFRLTLGRPRPWVVLKWAMSLDGRIAARRGHGGAISGVRARRLAHDWRAHADAIAVGIDTVLTDDPRLTCRLQGGVPHGRPQPLRVVFDSHLRMGSDRRLLDDLPDAGLTLFTTAAADAANRARLEGRGCEIVEVPAAGPDGHGVDLGAAMGVLYARGVRRLLVEGGARIHGAFLRAGLADQVSAFVAPIVLGGADAVPAVENAGVASIEDALHLGEIVWRRLGEDLLLQGYLPTA